MDFQMSYLTKGSSERTGKGLTIGSMYHLFAFHTILLGKEGKGDIRGGEELMESSRDYIEIVHGTNFEFNVFELERVFGIASSVSIFTRL